MKTKTLSIGTTGSQVSQLCQLEQKLTRHAHGLVKTAARTGTTDQRIKRFQAALDGAAGTVSFIGTPNFGQLFLGESNLKPRQLHTAA